MVCASLPLLSCHRDQLQALDPPFTKQEASLQQHHAQHVPMHLLSFT